jgi:hypothetical protein
MKNSYTVTKIFWQECDLTVAALQAELAVGGLGMGSLKSTQPAHYWNACTRALQAGGRFGSLVGVLPAAGTELTAAVP